MGKIYRTSVYEQDLKRIYRVSKRRFGKNVALETIRQLQELEQKALNDPEFGKINSDYHSPIFKYANILNRQTAFFERIGDDVVMITVGFDGRQWEKGLADIESKILEYINVLKSKDNY